MNSLIDETTKFRVSSVLNKDNKSYGKHFLCDGKEETCWNSDQGENQWIVVNFSKPVKINQIKIKFQGGFASYQFFMEKLDISKDSNEKCYVQIGEFFPEDINSDQIFESTKTDEASDCFRFKFTKTTDFFGRIIIYNFDLLGYCVEN